MLVNITIAVMTVLQSLGGMYLSLFPLKTKRSKHFVFGLYTVSLIIITCMTSWLFYDSIRALSHSEVNEFIVDWAEKEKLRSTTLPREQALFQMTVTDRMGMETKLVQSKEPKDKLQMYRMIKFPPALARCVDEDIFNKYIRDLRVEYDKMDIEYVNVNVYPKDHPQIMTRVSTIKTDFEARYIERYVKLMNAAVLAIHLLDKYVVDHGCKATR